MGDAQTPDVGETCGRCPAPTVYAVGGLMPAPPGWEATYRDDDLIENLGEEAPSDDELDDSALHVETVIAFDAQGNAQVMEHETGRLRAANSWNNFLAVRYRPDRVFSAFLPATGWQIAYGNAGTEPQVRPVVAWGVRPDGDVTPIHVDPCGTRDYVWAAEVGDAEYAQMKLIPPTLVAQARPTGRATATPTGRKVGGNADAQVGESGAAQSSPSRRAKASPTRPPKASPTGTPTVDDLSPAQRERLAQLGEQFPGEVPGRDVVIPHMREKGIPGFADKTKTDLLIKVLRADRARFAQMTAADQEGVPA